MANKQLRESIVPKHGICTALPPLETSEHVPEVDLCQNSVNNLAATSNLQMQHTCRCMKKDRKSRTLQTNLMKYMKILVNSETDLFMTFCRARLHLSGSVYELCEQCLDISCVSYAQPLDIVHKEDFIWTPKRVHKSLEIHLHKFTMRALSFVCVVATFWIRASSALECTEIPVHQSLQNCHLCIFASVSKDSIEFR